jgi:endoglycosylceramidase
MRRVLVLVILCVLWGCAEPEPERVTDPWITDDAGRVPILHGANVDGSAKDTPDHMPRQERAEIERMVTDWGWNHARFLIFWDGLEPEPGVIDQDYLDLIEGRMDWFEEMGVHVVLDMHQDVYSAAFCCDGAPEWAIRDDDEPFELQGQWFLNYFQPAVKRAFDNFWLYDDGEHADLQDHYGDVWVAVAERFADHPAVLGYDLMNEPHPGSMLDTVELFGDYNPDGTHLEFDRTRLQPFYQRLIDRIRTVDQDSWIFYEPRYGAPGDGRPSYMGALTDPREAGDRIVYYPHLYSVGLEASGSYGESDRTVADWERERALEMAAQNASMAIGEWGLNQDTDDVDRFMNDVLEMADRLMAGWAYWDYSFGGWIPVDGDGNERPMMDLLVRPYPRAVAGTPTAYGWHADTGLFFCELDTREGVTAPTEIHLPARHFGADPQVTVSAPDDGWGSVWRSDTEILEVTITAEGSFRIEVRPAEQAGQ